jgi:hypothetical protein
MTLDAELAPGLVPDDSAFHRMTVAATQSPDVARATGLTGMRPGPATCP